MLTLTCHPDTPAKAVTAVHVAIDREKNGNLLLRYEITGNPRQLTPSPLSPAAQQRGDELWQHTCCEAFLKPEGGEAYLEFNFAPTMAWQAYALSGYREGRRPADIMIPELERRTWPDCFELRARITDLPSATRDWKVGLSAVIEESDGTISYWALQHAPTKPDFHHPDAFALTVTP